MQLKWFHPFDRAGRGGRSLFYEWSHPSRRWCWTAALPERAFVRQRKRAAAFPAKWPRPVHSNNLLKVIYLLAMKGQDFILSSANYQDSVNIRFLNFRGTTARIFFLILFSHYFETSPFSTIINSKHCLVTADWILKEVCYRVLHWFWTESLEKRPRC